MILMEHSHYPLKFGFSLGILLFIIGVTLAFFGASGSDLHSKTTIYFAGGITIVVGTFVIKKTFKNRDNCQICKDKFRFGRKK